MARSLSMLRTLAVLVAVWSLLFAAACAVAGPTNNCADGCKMISYWATSTGPGGTWECWGFRDSTGGEEINALSYMYVGVPSGSYPTVPFTPTTTLTKYGCCCAYKCASMAGGIPYEVDGNYNCTPVCPNKMTDTYTKKKCS